MSYNGRRDIYTSVEELTDKNVLNEINKALAIHFINKAEEDYLFNYRKGIQPILYRTKERHEEICNKIVENHAESIVSFKNGFFLTQPAYNVARNEESTNKVSELNEYIYRSGKHQADNDLVDWFHTVGRAFLYVEPTQDDDTPFVAYALNPTKAEVVKSLRAGNEPVYGFHAVTDNEILYVDVYTKTTYYKLFGSIEPIHPTDNPNENVWVTKIIEKSPNRLAPYIPIIEYRYSKTNMGAFESVLDMLDAINNLNSNRMDGVEQFIQSLIVATNVDFEEGVTSRSLHESGMVCVNSPNDKQAKIEILSEELNQTQSQVYADALLEQVYNIVGMPSTQNSGSTSDNVGAVIYRNGWQNADAYAKNTEDEFKKSNRYFDLIVLKILKDRFGFELNTSDFELSFVRNEFSNIQAKAQACGTMVGFGLAPVLALEWSGLTNDPVTAYEMSKEFFEAKQNYSSNENEVEVEVIEEDTDINAYGNDMNNTAYGANEEIEDEITI